MMKAKVHGVIGRGVKECYVNDENILIFVMSDGKEVPIGFTGELKGIVPIDLGGTNAKNPADARKNLGITPGNIGAATSAEVDVERKRINNLASLKNGSTTGDAELTDIRVGYNGTTYPTAGEAVRGQVGELKEDLDGIENALRCYKSKNIFDTSKVRSGIAVSGNGTFDTSTDGTSCSDFCDCEGLTNIVFSFRYQYGYDDYQQKWTILRMVFFDKNKEFISSTPNWVNTAEVPSNAKYVVIGNVDFASRNGVMLESGTEPTTYEEYFEPYYTTENTIYDKKIAELEKLYCKSEVILPSAIYGVDGMEINIYKENLVKNCKLHDISYVHTRIEHSTQDDERVIWNPTTTTLSEVNTNVEIFKYGYDEQETKILKVCTVPKDTGTVSKKILIIGDSKVDNGFVSYHYLHNFDDDNMSVTLLGTKYDWSAENRNEGYGGKTAKWFCTDSESKFCNNGAFDFANYLSAYGVDTPDIVFINLGTNDCGVKAHGFEDEFVTYINQIITNIHSVSSNIHIVIGLCEGVSTNLDTNNAEFLNWDLNYKIHVLHKKTIETFDNRTDERIWVCPMYMGMDLKNDYNMEEVPLSERDSGKNSKTRMKITDRVHQNEIGYWKNADYMYAITKYIVAKGL